jgi:hypothetical protein
MYISGLANSIIKNGLENIIVIEIQQKEVFIEFKLYYMKILFLQCSSTLLQYDFEIYIKQFTYI